MLNPFLALRTLRHARARQLWHRCLRQAPRWHRPRDLASELRRPAGVWVEAIEAPSGVIGPEEFVFLNLRGSLSGGWNPPELPRLWRYNLHYFADLNSAGCELRLSSQMNLVKRWIAENPPGSQPGWEPYPTSRRIANWLKWVLRTGCQDKTVLDSLPRQADYLYDHIEFDVLVNHLLANAFALVMAGAVFAGPAAERWRGAGLGLLARELPEQVLGDGGHIERSPMYHSIVLADLLDLINLAGLYPDAVPTHTIGCWRSTAARMLSWLRAMCHPDGEIAFFNDAAPGIAPRPEDIAAYARRLGIEDASPAPGGVRHLGDSGYVRLAARDLTCLFDAAPLGASYQPGHSHADLLSFELSYREQRVLVNAGTSTYDVGPLRQYQRGTSAHSTVRIDGRDQAEVWHAFRVGRLAAPLYCRCSAGLGWATVTAAHDGYTCLRDRVVHRRELSVTEAGVTVRDFLDGRGTHGVEAFYHLHPDIRVAAGNGSVSLSLPGGKVFGFSPDRSLRVAVLDTEYFPGFGAAVPAKCLRLTWHGKLPVEFTTVLAMEMGEMAGTANQAQRAADACSTLLPISVLSD